LIRGLEEPWDSLDDARATIATSSFPTSTVGVAIEESIEPVLVGERAGKLVLLESERFVNERLGFETDLVDVADG